MHYTILPSTEQLGGPSIIDCTAKNSERTTPPQFGIEIESDYQLGKSLWPTNSKWSSQDAGGSATTRSLHDLWISHGHQENIVSTRTHTNFKLSMDGKLVKEK